MKDSVFLIIFLVAALSFPLPGQAAIVTYDLCVEFSDGTSPAGPAPWLRAAFDDDGDTGSVTLTMEDLNLTGTEFVSEWYFNLDPALDPTGLIINFSAGQSGAVSTGTDSFKADGDGLYDILFSFPTSGDRFGADQSSTWIFTLDRLTANSFNFLSLTGGGHGPYPTAAHVQDVDGSYGGWITTPIPGAVWLFGAGLLGLIGVRRKVKVT